MIVEPYGSSVITLGAIPKLSPMRGCFKYNYTIVLTKYNHYAIMTMYDSQSSIRANAHITTREKGMAMAKNQRNDADDKALSTSARSARENNEIRRAKKLAQKKNAGSGNGSMKTQDRNVGSAKAVRKNQYEEHQLRVKLAADAAVNDPTIQELRDSLSDMQEIVEHTLDERRKTSIQRKIDNQVEQLAMIDAALLAFGQKSNPLKRRTDVIKEIRLGTAYAGRIARDALFAANRRHQLTDSVVREGVQA